MAKTSQVLLTSHHSSQPFCLILPCKRCCDYIGPIWIIQDTFSIFLFYYQLISNLNSSLPCKTEHILRFQGLGYGLLGEYVVGEGGLLSCLLQNVINILDLRKDCNLGTGIIFVVSSQLCSDCIFHWWKLLRLLWSEIFPPSVAFALIPVYSFSSNGNLEV